MSMLEYFFSIKYAEKDPLFENLDIWKEKKYRDIRGTYPVIFLSFANVKGSNFETARKLICQLIVNLYSDCRFLVKSGFLEDEDRAYFYRISSDMSDADAILSIGQLSRYLYQYYEKKVIILLDEYDTPMQEAYLNGYWDKMAEFTRGIFHTAFKTNPCLGRGLMTGITRVSKESIFSDLNNLEVVIATSEKYAEFFGFTQNEVQQALEEYGLQNKEEEVKRWYDGFCFGNCESMYNPWSITQFLDKKVFAPYWANTSSNALVGKLIQESDREIKMIVEDLIKGKSFHVAADDQIVFNELDDNPDAIWSFLLAGGYLKYRPTGRAVLEDMMCCWSLPVAQMMESSWSLR